MFPLLTIDFGQTLTSFCPHPNLIHIIASIPLILLLFVAVSAIAVIICTTFILPAIAALSLLKIVAVISFILQIPVFTGELGILAGLTGITAALVWCIKFLSGCG